MAKVVVVVVVYHLTVSFVVSMATMQIHVLNLHLLLMYHLLVILILLVLFMCNVM